MERYTYRLQKTSENSNYQTVYDLFVREVNPSDITTDGGWMEIIYEFKDEKKLFTGFLQDCSLYMELHKKGII